MRRCSPKEAIPFLASKWLHIELLVDVDEMKDLFQELDPVFLFSTMGIQAVGGSALSVEQFLGQYGRYVELLRSGKVVIDDEFRFAFTTLITRSLNAVQAIQIGENREIISPILPIVQMKLHRFDFSSIDHKIRPLVFGPNTISWGLQISYPQLFQDPISRQIEQANLSDRFENAALFRTIQLWMRKHTLPVPFLIDGKRVNATIRIGKKCLGWIHAHAELQKRKLVVEVLHGD